ncbi:MAG: putative thiosulfate sulfurtransferase [Nocardia sp.]|uniref:sulfurtransferase n=1 Tax=Nocardia sp. TaxID=1821 RepID=UPI00260B839F|nr:sulfurtransferase [Nocardia sp.]MCU1641764.1 putative thiosulfate sulfurtransferase [Nocardia sp.]
MPSRTETLITVDELASRITAVEPLVVLDVRWQLDRPDGRDIYAESHIPGAVYVDLETELSDHALAGRGRHPLPSGSALQAAARRWGVRAGVPIIVYDNWNRAGSARAWWLLRAAGITDVRILDGGLGAWVAAGHDVAAGAVHPRPGDVRIAHDDLYAGAAATLSADEAAVLAADGALIDARAPERFRGEVEPVDAVPGHVPGARNVPSGSVLDEHGFFRPTAELEALFKQVRDADRVGAYCGSGVTAAVDIAALRVLGIDAALFPGSWSQWSSEAERPVATGFEA